MVHYYCVLLILQQSVKNQESENTFFYARARVCFYVFIFRFYDLRSYLGYQGKENGFLVILVGIYS